MSEPGKPLDIDTVQAFVLIADFASFTRAAQALDTSQAAISLKLKRLEERLGQRLLERTPRHVRLTPAGARFSQAARELLRAHERALGELHNSAPRRLQVGISDHVAGPDLPQLLQHIASYDPLLLLEVHIDSSRELTARFDRAELDAVIVRNEGARNDGEVLVVESFAWFAAATWQHTHGSPLRLATLAAPCGVRQLAVQALDAAGWPWVEVFIGGGVMAVGAAVSAGLGVAALASRVAPAGAQDVTERLGLPRLPVSEVVLHARATDERSADTLRALSAAFRGALLR
ncbi:LysR family transcriptional regulator [Pseudomonas sp. PH1b]|uniref:LysR family transcriptional regulator n=1 Tax=Pseudomonas sp. PH1b TaxID=1397282 RepID=UPI000468BFC6|nr:LysR family transcriptional regulator [Pseudomonas sp. PH1b]